MVYATRTTPPNGLSELFQAFDTAVRECLEAACSGPLTVEAWTQASLSTRCGGLGLRSVTMHAAAGFAASVCATATLCSAIDNGYVPNIEAAIQQVNQQLPPELTFSFYSRLESMPSPMLLWGFPLHLPSSQQW